VAQISHIIGTKSFVREIRLPALTAALAARSVSMQSYPALHTKLPH
jgi:hypothetical protein